MAQDLFISHSARDKVVADAVCAALESAAVRCWMAPRDVPPGRSFAGEITRAIQQSRVMVLIFSAHSNNSGQVLREVQLAVSSHLHIIQFRIEDVRPNDDLEYYLSTPHWLDALTPPLENHLKRLGTSIKGLLEISTEDRGEVAPASEATVPAKTNQTTRSQIAIPPARSAPPRPITAKTKRALWITLATATLFIGIAIVSFHVFRRAPTQTAPSSPAPVIATRPLPEPPASPATPTRMSFVPQLNIKPETSLREAGL